jgi:hypothetical protein
MTRKDFIELANQLALVKDRIEADWDTAEWNNPRDVWRECVQAVMLACRTTSANFNTARFLEACGVPNALSTKENK